MDNNTVPAEVKGVGYTEKLLKPMSGYIMLALNLLLIAGSVVMIATGGVFDIIPVFVIGFLLIPVWLFLLYGYCVIAPNEAVVLTLFGKYKGTIREEGYYWYSPFCRKFNPAAAAMGPRRKHVSLKAMTLNNEKQKVNDADGNPIEIGVVVIWRIRDAAKAVFNVDNYVNFIAIQSDAAIRNIARQYPYDVTEDDEKSLRGSAQEIHRGRRSAHRSPCLRAGDRRSNAPTPAGKSHSGRPHHHRGRRGRHGGTRPRQTRRNGTRLPRRRPQSANGLQPDGGTVC